MGGNSGSSENICRICGSKLVVVEYRGHNPEVLALMKSDGFCHFLGCTRVDLHNKVMDGVNYRGKVVVRPVFHRR